MFSSAEYTHGFDLNFDLYQLHQSQSQLQPSQSQQQQQQHSQTQQVQHLTSAQQLQQAQLVSSTFAMQPLLENQDLLYHNDISANVPVSSSASLSSFTTTTSTTPSDSRTSVSSNDSTSMYFMEHDKQEQFSMFAQPYPFALSNSTTAAAAAAAAVASQQTSALSSSYNQLFLHSQKRSSLISPVVVSAPGSLSTNNTNTNINISMSTGNTNSGTLSTPPSSPAHNFLSLDNSNAVLNYNTYQFDFDDVPHDTFFNTEGLFESTSAAQQIQPVPQPLQQSNYLYAKTVPTTPISEGDSVSSPLIMIPSSVSGSTSMSSSNRNLVLESQTFSHPKRPSVSKKRRNTEPINAPLVGTSTTSPLDVKTAIELATKAFTRNTKSSPSLHNQNHNSDHAHHHQHFDYPTEYKYDKPVKEELLERFTPNSIREIKLTESDLFCKNHCNAKFPNYLSMIEHFDKNRLNLIDYRAFKCPVVECPMNILGYEKKADLRHHVVIDHFKKGKVLDQFDRYSQQLQSIIYVCTQDNCGKGFYRRDSLTRHIKLVHQNEASLFNQKRRQSEVGNFDEYEEDVHLKSKKRKRRKRN